MNAFTDHRDSDFLIVRYNALFTITHIVQYNVYDTHLHLVPFHDNFPFSQSFLTLAWMCSPYLDVFWLQWSTSCPFCGNFEPRNWRYNGKSSLFSGREGEFAHLLNFGAFPSNQLGLLNIIFVVRWIFLVKRKQLNHICKNMNQSRNFILQGCDNFWENNLLPFWGIRMFFMNNNVSEFFVSNLTTFFNCK